MRCSLSEPPASAGQGGVQFPGFTNKPEAMVAGRATRIRLSCAGPLPIVEPYADAGMAQG